MKPISVHVLHMKDMPNRSFYSIRKKRLSSDYPLHQHDFFEIEFVLSGGGTHYLNGHAYTLQRGSAYFLNRNDFHQITLEKPTDFLTLMFSDHWISEDLLFRVLPSEADLQCLLEEEMLNDLLSITTLIQQEYQEARPYWESSIRNLNEYLLLRLMRCFDVPNLFADACKRSDPVSKAILYLNNHFRESPTLSAVAEVVNHNSTYFSELFHKSTGQSYVQYVNTLKLNYACKLLAFTDQSITGISAASGFRTYSSFAAAFRQAFGCSAYAFRHAHRRDRDADWEQNEWKVSE